MLLLAVRQTLTSDKTLADSRALSRVGGKGHLNLKTGSIIPLICSFFVIREDIRWVITSQVYLQSYNWNLMTHMEPEPRGESSSYSLKFNAGL